MSMSDTVQKRYKITWLNNAFKVKGSKHSLAFGVCEHSKKIAFVTVSDDVLTQLVVHDLYIVNSECEEGRCCLCRSCPLNETTASSLSASGKRWRGTKAAVLKRMHKRLAKIEKILKREIDSIDWQKKQVVLHFEKTPIVLARVDSQEPTSDLEK